MKKITLLFTILISVVAIQISFAAPSLTITKPPVTPVPSWTGPGIPMPPLAPSGDPHAEFGQWFTNLITGDFERRTHEFYDNVHPGFGGGYASCTAIFGYVSQIVYQSGPGTPIMAFDIFATISNDIPALSEWQQGDNSHNEIRNFINLADQKQEGPLLDVKLTAEFSIDPSVPFPIPFPAGPYMDPYPGVYIEAVNHDELAWYCWTENNPVHTPYGDFHVPTWDFGSIPQGAAKSRTLSFAIPAGLPTADPRYLVIEQSLAEQADILINRTTSLKISEWIEDLSLDTCQPYPIPPARSSDVSVFHNVPEPGIFAGITIIILTLFRKK